MRIRTIAGAATAAAAAAAITLFPATANAEVRPDTSMNVCNASAVPTGWMITAFVDWYQCGTPDQYIYDAKVITDVSGTPAGGTATACTGPAPAGFYATSLSYSYSCSGSKTPDGILNDQQTVTNLNGLPAGTTTTICGMQASPSGWVTVAIVQAYQCVLARGGGVGDNAISIRKV